MKTIKRFHFKTGSVSIRRDQEWDEYRVVTVCSDARLTGIYHTPDKADAVTTAALMASKLRALETF